MEQKVLDVMTNCFSEEAVSLLRVKLQEEESKVRLAIIQAVPLVVNSLLARGQRDDGAEVLWQLAYEANASGLPRQVDALSSTNWMSRGTAMMESLLADAYGMTLLRMAAATGIRPASAESILGAALALVLGALGEYAAQHQLQAPGLLAWLQWQETDIVGALPGYSRRPAVESVGEKPALISPPAMAPALGSWTSVGGGMAYAAPTLAAPEPARSPTVKWQWGGLLLLAVGMGYFLGHDRIPGLTDATALAPASTASLLAGTGASSGRAPAASSPGAAPGHYNSETDTYIYDTGQPTILQLADGTTQKVGLNSTENRLYLFLANPTTQVDSVNRTKGWINCDRVYFETGQATLTEDSQQQLRNIASILRTFPTAKVKFGGYTDSTGNALKNYKISEERAKTAMLALGSMGIDINRIEAKGYGGKFFLTSNNTLEGRALNRRISIRVLKK